MEQKLKITVTGTYEITIPYNHEHYEDMTLQDAIEYEKGNGAELLDNGLMSGDINIKVEVEIEEN